LTNFISGLFSGGGIQDAEHRLQSLKRDQAGNHHEFVIEPRMPEQAAGGLQQSARPVEVFRISDSGQRFPTGRESMESAK